jgi:large subunit ribosomal protein L10
MAKTKDQKKEIVANLETIFKDSVSTVLVHFKGINAGQETAMRRGFRSDGINYVVAKKSLIRRALANLGHAQEGVAMEGEIAVAYNTASNTDATIAASRVYGFGREYGAEKVSILGGLFEGKLMDAVAMTEIATIPALPVLRGMFVNVINSPIAGFVVALQAIADKKATNTVS